MKYEIECTSNYKIESNFITSFRWDTYNIRLNYDYDTDKCSVLINDSDWVRDQNKKLDKLVKGLINSMKGLEFEECYVGEKFSVNTLYM